MNGGGQLWWYECDVLPLVGFVRAPDAESARIAALDVSTNALRDYLANGEWRVEPIDVQEETTNAPHR